MIDTFRNHIDHFRAMRVRQTSRYWRATAELPATLYPYWQRSVQFEFKGIPRDAFFLVLHGLPGSNLRNEKAVKKG